MKDSNQINGVLNTRFILKDTYQRPLDEALVRKIVAHWNPNLMNLPKVSHRDGKYYVFDGQHTIEALKLKNNGKDLDIPCRIYSGMTYEDEARLFAAQNGISKNVTTMQKLRALYEAKDPDVVRVTDIVIEYGYADPIKNNSNNCPTGFRTLPSALKIYEKCGEGRLRQVLKVITGAWGNDKDGCRSGILNGINIVLSLYMGEVKEADLINSLKRVSPVKLFADAKADTAHSGANRFAYQIVRLYNKKKQYRLDEREIR